MGDTLVGPGQPVAADVRGDMPDWWDKVVEQGFVDVQDTLRKEARKLGFRLWRWKGAMGKLADDAEEQVAPPHHDNIHKNIQHQNSRVAGFSEPGGTKNPRR